MQIGRFCVGLELRAMFRLWESLVTVKIVVVLCLLLQWQLASTACLKRVLQGQMRVRVRRSLRV